MSRVNPIHIAILLVVILLFMMVQLNVAKKELAEEKLSYSTTLSLADKIKGLKSSYFDKNKVQKSLNRILRQSILQTANITKKVTNSSMLISSEDMNIHSLNFLMGKVLNGTYNVSELKIKRLSDEKASFTMEIKW